MTCKVSCIKITPTWSRYSKCNHIATLKYLKKSGAVQGCSPGSKFAAWTWVPHRSESKWQICRMDYTPTWHLAFSSRYHAEMQSEWRTHHLDSCLPSTHLKKPSKRNVPFKWLDVPPFCSAGPTEPPPTERGEEDPKAHKPK